MIKFWYQYSIGQKVESRERFETVPCRVLKTKNPPVFVSGGFRLKVKRRKEIFSFVAFNYTTFTLKED